MICSPASPARCSTCGCSSSHSSTNGSGKCTANCFAPTTSNFRLDFFALLWYLIAIAALLFQRKVLILDSIRVRAESRYFHFQVSTKGGTTSTIPGVVGDRATHPSRGFENGIAVGGSCAICWLNPTHQWHR